jgi:hypothetical protein
VAQRRYMTWIDTAGHTRLTFLQSGAGAATVEAALLAQSNANVLNSEDAALTVNSTPSPVAAVYAAVGDSAALTFTSAGGQLTVVQLPAPKAGIFMADGETVDPAAIAALTAAVVGTVQTAGGGLVTAFVSGVRRKTQREDY